MPQSPGSETAIQRALLMEMGSRPDARMFRNQVGSGWVASRSRQLPDGCLVLIGARRVSMGLAVGSSDLVGLRRVVIGPEHVGRTLAVFVSAEVKTETGRRSEEQAAWARLMESMGALHGTLRASGEGAALLDTI